VRTVEHAPVELGYSDACIREHIDDALRTSDLCCIGREAFVDYRYLIRVCRDLPREAALPRTLCVAPEQLGIAEVHRQRRAFGATMPSAAPATTAASGLDESAEIRERACARPAGSRPLSHPPDRG